jgi:hypothetical protein
VLLHLRGARVLGMVKLAKRPVQIVVAEEACDGESFAVAVRYGDPALTVDLFRTDGDHRSIDGGGGAGGGGGGGIEVQSGVRQLLHDNHFTSVDRVLCADYVGRGSEQLMLVSLRAVRELNAGGYETRCRFKLIGGGRALNCAGQLELPGRSGRDMGLPLSVAAAVRRWGGA